MKTIAALAKSRIRFNKSRSILTLIAILLTTTLLMALGTSCMSLLDMQRHQVETTGSNQHATFKDLTPEQFSLLSKHIDIESIQTNEIFATVVYDKVNALLTYSNPVKGEIISGLGNIVEGHTAQTADEISGSPAFFERMGVQARIGNKITVPFRANGEGEIINKEFTISGITSQRDISDMNISDSRIMYGATVSEELLRRYIPDQERRYNAVVRIQGEQDLNYDQIEQKLYQIGSDIGVKKDDINLNKEYLVVMTDPGLEILGVGAAIAALIILFSGLVIYSIYYVSVITDVQELGKLKALGASKRQIKHLLLREGFTLCALAIPIGLLLGYLIPYLIFPLMLKSMMNMDYQPHMFSFGILLLVIVIVFVTVYLSLLKPMRMAAKISPIEAIRYQEDTAGKQAQRKGNKAVTLSRLSWANLSRNRKRTIVTITTMGLSCVLFMALAGLMNSMDLYDIAHRNMPSGDFIIKLNYSLNDKTYPENNLDSLQKQDILGNKMAETLQGIPGVTKTSSNQLVPVSADYKSELFENGSRTSISSFTKEDVPEMKKKLKRGEIDYDKLVAENGVIFQFDSGFEQYGYALGDKIPFVLYDGDRQVPFTATLAASITNGDSSFAVPKEVMDRLIQNVTPTSSISINVEKSAYDSVKTALEQITDSQDALRLYSLDEELRIADMSVKMIKYPVYAILIMIGVIGFMNLINTMVTSIVTRKRELGILQALGMSDRQLIKMLRKEGMVFTLGTLVSALVVGNLLGYLLFLYGKNSGFMSITMYHYPLWETIFLALALCIGQLLITYFISKRIHKESLIERMRTQE